MSEEERLAKWARRRSSGQGPVPGVAQAPTQPQLPPPPPGHAWGWNPQANAYVLIPVNQPMAIQPPNQAWAGRPAPNFQATGHAPAGPRMETCMVVKPGNTDPWENLLANVPELMPDMTGGADAMAGQMSEESSRVLAGSQSGMGQPLVQRDSDYRGARGNRPSPTRSPELGSVPLPKIDPEG